MFGSLGAELRRLRVILMALVAVFTTALFITPATAAGHLHQLDGTAMATIIVVGILLFAIVFEAWRIIQRKTIPVRNRATQDWAPRRRD